MNQFYECGDCYACCDGNLISNAHGNKFGHGKPCVFLVNRLCSIYEHRPNACHSFQCAWSQKLFPEWMKPNKCGVLISVEFDIDHNQYLKVIEIKPEVEYSVYQELKKFCENNNTYYVKVPYERKSEYT